MNTLEAIKMRKSVRSYLAKPLEEDKVKAVAEARSGYAECHYESGNTSHDLRDGCAGDEELRQSFPRKGSFRSGLQSDL